MSATRGPTRNSFSIDSVATLTLITTGGQAEVIIMAARTAESVLAFGQLLSLVHYTLAFWAAVGGYSAPSLAGSILGPLPEVVSPMLPSFLVYGRALLLSRSSLALENLALRQQLAVYHQTISRPVITTRDRVFWVMMSRIWRGWRDALIIVKPDTVIRWHRAGFSLFWGWKSRGAQPGRPPIMMDVIVLIRHMSVENTTWGAARIQAELRLLGIEVSEATVAKYTARRVRRPPSQTWRTFLDNHVNQLAACDFFVVPTATFRLLWCFVVLSHDRRRIVHVNVTRNPTAAWTAQQMVEAFPGDVVAPRFLLRDRDQIYGKVFRSRLNGMKIAEVITAYRTPWQNPYAKRVIGTIRRECANHLIVLSESHLRRLMKQYVDYYNTSRPHSSLDRNAPLPRKIEPPERGAVLAEPVLGGLHHRYRRAA